jgi:hypothetical protein
MAVAALLPEKASAQVVAEVEPRRGFYLDVRAAPALMINDRDDGARGGASNDGMNTAFALDAGVAVGAAARPGLALAGQLGVLGGDAGHMAIIGHAGPMVEWFSRGQRTGRLHAGASFAMGWFGSSADAIGSAAPPTDNQLVGAAAFVGGGATLSGTVVPGVFVRTTGAALFGEGTSNYTLVVGAGLDLMVF